MMTATTSAASTHTRGLRMIVFMSSRVPARSHRNGGGASWRGRACRYATYALEGSAAEVVVVAAERGRADEIVVGTRGRGASSRRWS